MSFPNIKYGYYCGIYHYDKYGRRPIDTLDAACQIHDICTTESIFDCYCNQQLFWAMGNIGPSQANTSAARNSMMRWIYYSIGGCSINHFGFHKVKYIGSLHHQGFNYLPIYEEGAYEIKTPHSLFILHNANYTEMTYKTYSGSWGQYVIGQVQGRKTINLKAGSLLFNRNITLIKIEIEKIGPYQHSTLFLILFFIGIIVLFPICAFMIGVLIKMTHKFFK